MLLDILKARRSIRKYQDKKIEQEMINLLIKAALLAPSSRSIRPWQFIVVTDTQLLQELSLCRNPGPRFVEGAPLAIVVIADRVASDVWVEDASIASTLIQLMAQDIGLGSCWIQVRNRNYSEQESTESYIKRLLEIPEQFSVENIIAIGYPAEEKKSYDEESLLYPKIHYNKF